MTRKTRYFDIGVNFTDPMFHGVYHGKQYHETDLKQVISRAKLFNVDKMLVTGSSIEESRKVLDVCSKYSGLYGTAGIHPCTVEEEFYRDGELAADYEAKLNELEDVVIQGKNTKLLKSFGEIGLDYDRLHYTPEDHQKLFFQKQLDIAVKTDLPLFLHMRAACDDFVDIIKPYLTGENGKKLTKNGVVHSFTGTKEELHKLLDLGFYIGINGCSLKTEENLEVAKLIPLDKLMIETDAPWCGVKRTHAGYKYVTPYPNEYYPEIEQEEEREVVEAESPLEQQKPLKKKGANNQKKQQPQRMDDFLPFPSIKNANYNKFYENNVNIQLIGEKSHPMINSRNEPVLVGLVAEILSKIMEVPANVIIGNAYKNSCELFEVELE